MKGHMRTGISLIITQQYKQHKEKGFLQKTIKHPKNAMCETENS